MTDKHARRSAHNTKSMNDFLTRKEALALLRNVGLIDERGEPVGAQHAYDIERIWSDLQAHIRGHHAPWYRRLWARVRRGR